jgi:hypothetical protein
VSVFEDLKHVVALLVTARRQAPVVEHQDAAGAAEGVTVSCAAELNECRRVAHFAQVEPLLRSYYLLSRKTTGRVSVDVARRTEGRPDESALKSTAVVAEA